jgi:hypothetical protein
MSAMVEQRFRDKHTAHAAFTKSQPDSICTDREQLRSRRFAPRGDTVSRRNTFVRGRSIESKIDVVATSVDPSSTTMVSTLWSVCSRTLSTASRTNSP